MNVLLRSGTCRDGFAGDLGKKINGILSHFTVGSPFSSDEGN